MKLFLCVCALALSTVYAENNEQNNQEQQVAEQKQQQDDPKPFNEQPEGFDPAAN